MCPADTCLDMNDQWRSQDRIFGGEQMRVWTGEGGKKGVASMRGTKRDVELGG